MFKRVQRCNKQKNYNSVTYYHVKRTAPPHITHNKTKCMIMNDSLSERASSSAVSPRFAMKEERDEEKKMNEVSEMHNVYLVKLVLNILQDLRVVEHIENCPVHCSLYSFHACAVHIPKNLIDLTVCKIKKRKKRNAISMCTPGCMCT